MIPSEAVGRHPFPHGEVAPKPNLPALHRNGNGALERAGIVRQEASAELRRYNNTVTASSTSRLELLLVDDDLPVLKACSEVASGIGFLVHSASSAGDARNFVTMHSPDVVLMDLKMPSGGLSLLEDIRTQRPRSSVVVMTAFATVSSAVEAMRIGATDYLTKPFAMDELTSVLERASQRRSVELEGQRVQGQPKLKPQGSLISTSPEMTKLMRIVQKVATATHPVLILGESGTGKESIARAIHAVGSNATKRFTVIECAQLAPAVLEAELFGSAKGADRGKCGALVAPEGGTLFLDGISEIPMDLQAKLLRALQDRQVRLSESEKPSPVTVRLLASSSRDISALVDQAAFRKDLYYRLNVVSLRMPPLRDRKEDIPLLAEHFLERMRRESAVSHQLAADAIQVLMDYAWPGNVRELESAIERACALSSGPVLHMSDMPTQMQTAALAQPAPEPVVRVDARDNGEAQATAKFRPPTSIVSIAELERDAIIHTIRQLHGDKLMAAKLLGIGKTTLYRKLKEYGIADS